MISSRLAEPAGLLLFIDSDRVAWLHVVGRLFAGANPLPGGGHGIPTFMTEAHLVNMAGHAAVGCGMAVAAGGKCGSGALSGLAPAFAGPLLPTHNSAARLVTKATLGGLGSVAGGGKFENGAITGAFGYLFNEVGLACRGVANIGGYTHCGLFVFDRNGDDLRIADIRAQYSLGKGQTRFNNVFDTWQHDREAFWSGKGYYRVDPPPGMSQQEFDAAVISNADFYNASRYDARRGPNSNSGAAYPVIVTGARLPNIPGALFEGNEGPRALRYWQNLRDWPAP